MYTVTERERAVPPLRVFLTSEGGRPRLFASIDHNHHFFPKKSLSLSCISAAASAPPLSPNVTWERERAFVRRSVGRRTGRVERNAGVKSDERTTGKATGSGRAERASRQTSRTEKSTAAEITIAPPMSANGGASTFPHVPLTPQPSTSSFAFAASWYANDDGAAWSR